MPLFKKGHEFHGPDGQGYRLTRDVESGEIILSSDLEPFGGAPEPKPGDPIPEWLALPFNWFLT